ncbi:MAG TPA: nicotinate (nicotinamide) nucleotide adenylyltransferase [Clostridiales bacterium]|jgi:nicotinate-nucleotide adenylyltransferase|nr:nicotinate (nicotinamide) nucleotide adenylyltransferase [Clostridiales bacterium]
MSFLWDRPRVGIYGGTFAPFHNGHMALLKAFLCECPLDAVYVIPASIPPHKQIDFADNPRQRLEMLKPALRSLPEWGERLFVSTYEINRKGPSYTYLTLGYFHEVLSTDITFLCGGDMFSTLSGWRCADEIFRLAKIAYAGRPGIDIEGYAERYKVEFGARLIRLSAPQLDISSTEIRKIAGEGGDISGLVPPETALYIKENGLYKNV